MQDQFSQIQDISKYRNYIYIVCLQWVILVHFRKSSFYYNRSVTVYTTFMRDDNVHYTVSLRKTKCFYILISHKGILYEPISCNICGQH